MASEMVHLVGDTMYENIHEHMEDILGDDVVERLGLDEPYAVLTVHRAENTDNEERLRGIMRGVRGLGMKVVFPCHPRTRGRLARAAVHTKRILMHSVIIASCLNPFDVQARLRAERKQDRKQNQKQNQKLSPNSHQNLTQRKGFV